ncbi:TniQ family protein [Brevibacillus sp. AY1]|uniref:TniQ family protein n=1 Tax=Brevibacillus sp. AY1 TaxID=2807621 RepID=UPI002455D572|nr:TniQ family protein [Brevibacillus sp. AY1]MDH4619436.1 TniQ family protein [Brevibacillus sp. AY1]
MKYIKSMNIFETLDIDDPDIPERSKVIQLQPMAMDSLDIESLTSYILRMAEAHSVTSGTFTKELLLPFLIDGEITKSALVNTHYRIYSKSFSINGIKMMAIKMSSALNELTLEKNKEKLTFLRLAELMYTSDIQTRRQWCSHCLEEFKNSKTVYEKLIWNVKIVNICLIHRRRLESCCPHCGEQIWSINTKSRVGYCDKCNEWLGSNLKHSINIDEEEYNWQVWVHQSLEYLLGCTNLSISKKQICERLQEFFSVTLKNNKITKVDFAKYMGFSRHAIFEWIRGKGTFSIYSLFLICYCSNISLKRFLEEDLSTITINKINWGPQRKSLGNERIKLPIEERGRILNRVIEENAYPPPKLSDITKALGFLSNESLRAYFPRECRLISQRYKEYKSQVSKENHIYMEIKLETYIIECANTGVYPSIDLLARKLGVHQKLVSFSLKDKRYEVMKKLGINIKNNGPK